MFLSDLWGQIENLKGENVCEQCKNKKAQGCKPQDRSAEFPSMQYGAIGRSREWGGYYCVRYVTRDVHGKKLEPKARRMSLGQ